MSGRPRRSISAPAAAMRALLARVLNLQLCLLQLAKLRSCGSRQLCRDLHQIPRENGEACTSCRGPADSRLCSSSGTSIGSQARSTQLGTPKLGLGPPALCAAASKLLRLASRLQRCPAGTAVLPAQPVSSSQTAVELLRSRFSCVQSHTPLKPGASWAVLADSRLC